MEKEIIFIMDCSNCIYSRKIDLSECSNCEDYSNWVRDEKW